jgi:hypothetical protein
MSYCRRGKKRGGWTLFISLLCLFWLARQNAFAHVLSMYFPLLLFLKLSLLILHGFVMVTFEGWASTLTHTHVGLDYLDRAFTLPFPAWLFCAKGGLETAGPLIFFPLLLL